MADEIVAIDIGGTHARFAIAAIENRAVVRLDPPTTLRTADHSSLQLAYEAFGRVAARTLPRAAAIAIAAPPQGDEIKLTNNPWVIRPAQLPALLGIDDYLLINDFGAVGHAVTACGPEWFRHLCGPDAPLPLDGVVSVIGPGTGLGVAQIVPTAAGPQVIETEGGHIDFAPLDAIEQTILERLRARFGRVSAERIASGPGLANLYEALAVIEGRAVHTGDEKALWTRALAGEDSLASAALDRFCRTLGAVAGDMALAHGAGGVVVSGGLGLRLAAYLPQSGFRQRFVAKGRFERRMAAIPVRIIVHPEPGLLGAAVAFARRGTGGRATWH